eukprot:13168170-Alexandrium_andersonii.AAC.1
MLLEVARSCLGLFWSLSGAFGRARALSGSFGASPEIARKRPESTAKLPETVSSGFSRHRNHQDSSCWMSDGLVLEMFRRAALLRDEQL